MAGRQTFFSFHYQRDVWRAAQVRNAGVVDATAAAGWNDASIWEEAKRKGERALATMIDSALVGTTVTVVLIGAMTSTRRWVRYEIEKSLERGNGLLGIYINTLKDREGKIDLRGAPPNLLRANNIPCYNWDRFSFGKWVEQAAVGAGHLCLRHRKLFCSSCG